MDISLKKDFKNLLALACLCVVIFGVGLGSFGLLDPDEPFYSLTAKEMLASHDLSTPRLFGHPQFEKPILFYWVICLCFKLFGISEFASRLGSLCAGLATVGITYLWGVALFRDRRIAFVSAIVLATAAEFVVVSRIVLTDIYLCLFITVALFSFSVGYGNQDIRKKAWFFVFVSCALGFLTKGPLAILIPWMGIAAFLTINREAKLFKQFPWVLGLITFAAIGLPWYVLMTTRYGTGFLEHFFIHENAKRFFFAEHTSHDKIFLYPGAMLVGFFPWNVFLIAAVFYGFRRAFGTRPGFFHKSFLFLSLFFIPTLIFLTLAKSKLLSYILPVFPAIALLIGAWMILAYRAVRQGATLKSSVRFFSVLFWGVLPVGLVAGVWIYSSKNSLDLFWPIFSVGIFLIPLSWAALWSFLKKRYLSAFYSVLSAVSLSYLAVFGWLLGAADSSFSTKGEAAIYLKLVSADRPAFILANKMFIRGATYYTGNQRGGVLTENPESTFYSKHPIPMISNLQDLQKIDKRLYPVYCFLKPKDLKFLKKIINNEFSIVTLQANANRTLVKLDRADASL